ncbi:M48 family metallopeptidase [Ruminococcus sp.]|uniref:M48 family metallopeptidase n=1 Tax=Ruminococcus sp. TaxID=41978 RepID=UPI00386E5C11
MNDFELYLGPINGTVKVTVQKKKIKNVHLKVFRSFEVFLSVPEQVPDEWIQSFLSDHVKWIDDQITKYKKTSGYNNLLDIKNGSSIQYLGKDMRIHKEASLKNYVEVDEKIIHLYVIDQTNEELIQKLFNKWWRESARKVYQKEVDSYYDRVIRKYNIDKPTIIIKKMKTLWGSCTPQKCKITFNEYLLKANLRCIQYVVLHELTHLLYPNHNVEFYNFLTIHMPDWKERKMQLDTEVVQGL